MLQINQITKSYGIQTILDGVTFAVNPGDRVGLVGPNGAGKSTLLRIVTGEEAPDSGTVSLSASDTLGYLPQGFEADLKLTVAEAVRSGLPALAEAQRQMEALATRLASDTSPQVLRDYGEALTRFEALDGYSVENRLVEILAGLGLADIDLDAPLSQLSGGERTRVGLARLLLSGASILLLDEPTNHLDIQALEWLEDFLRAYPGAVLVVSHDRVFLDRTVRRIVELDDITRLAREFPGNYTDYAQAVAQEMEKLRATWKDQETEIRRLEADVVRTKEQARSTENTTNDSTTRRYAKKVARKALSKEKRLKRYLESPERVEKPAEKWRMRLDFGDSPRSGQIVVDLADIGQAFDGRWLFRGINQVLQQGERVALVGPNGAGKTTLLRILVGETQPSEGIVRVGPSVRMGYMPQQQETLDPAATALDILRQTVPMSQTELHHFLHFFLFEADDLYVPVGELSYGERARLLLARLVASGANCLLLDEPVNHLDIPARQQFETALEAFPGTVLVSVHDRAFIDRIASSIWSLEDGSLVKRYSGGWRESARGELAQAE